MTRRTPRATHLPYTTLYRSDREVEAQLKHAEDGGDRRSRLQEFPRPRGRGPIEARRRRRPRARSARGFLDREVEAQLKPLPPLHPVPGVGSFLDREVEAQLKPQNR